MGSYSRKPASVVGLEESASRENIKVGTVPGRRDGLNEWIVGRVEHRTAVRPAGMVPKAT